MKILKYMILKNIFIFFKFFLVIAAPKILFYNLCKKKKLLKIKESVYFEKFGFQILNIKYINHFLQKKNLKKKISGLRIFLIYGENKKVFNFLINDFLNLKGILEKKIERSEQNKTIDLELKVTFIFARTDYLFFYKQNFLFYMYKLKLNFTIFYFLYTLLQQNIKQLFSKIKYDNN